jgi:IS4 transposase
MNLVYSSFYERFNVQLVKFLEACVHHALPHLIEHSTGTLLAQYQRFQDILVKDNTIVRIHDGLSKKYPAARSRNVAAGVKVSVLLSVIAHGPKSVSFHPERTAEVKTLKIGPWVRDTLLLFDLGFYKHHLLARVMENGGCFVTRLKRTTNPVVKDIHSPCNEALKIYCRGKPLQDIIHLFKGVNLDASVAIEFKRRSYRNKRKSDTTIVRFVAEWNEKSKVHHTYLTNIVSEDFPASDIVALYKSRWEIELLFKEMKGGYGIDEITSKNECIVQSFLFAAIITTLVSRTVYHAIRNFAMDDDFQRMNHLLWCSAFIDSLPLLLMAIIPSSDPLDFNDHLWARLRFSLGSLGIGPHRSRKQMRTGIWA